MNQKLVDAWNEKEAMLWAKLPEPKDERFRVLAALDENGRLVLDELHEYKLQDIQVEFDRPLEMSNLAKDLEGVAYCESTVALMDSTDFQHAMFEKDNSDSAAQQAAVSPSNGLAGVVEFCLWHPNYECQAYRTTFDRLIRGELDLCQGSDGKFDRYYSEPLLKLRDELRRLADLVESELNSHEIQGSRNV